MESIYDFVGGMNFDEFSYDDKTVSAVIRKFEIIGEAAKQIPEDIQRTHCQIPWREMAGMRDRMIHFYFGIDHSLVWETIVKRLPEVKSAIERVLEEHENT